MKETGTRVIALGFFDGVHIGHGALLHRTRERATQLGLRAAAMSFDSHPNALVFGEAVRLINTMDDRARLMRRLYGIDDVIFAHFDRAMMEMPWEEFLGDFLVRENGAVHLVCGHDFRFGYRGEGDAEKLRTYCAAHGLGCDVIPPVTIDGRTVSSTYIRALIAEGRMEEAERFLGHAHLLSGPVRHGYGRGGKIDMPTANLAFPAGVLVPAYGVYAAEAEVNGTRFAAIVNVGIHPTVGALDAPVLEAWIQGDCGDLYGKEMTVFLYHQIRGERKFPSMEALKEQVLRDTEEAMDYLRTRGEGVCRNCCTN